MLTCFLVACIFGAPITAARLSQDLVIIHNSGFAYVKGTNSGVLRTSETVIYEWGTNIGQMSAEQLRHLREIILEDGSLRFSVPGSRPRTAERLRRHDRGRWDRHLRRGGHHRRAGGSPDTFSKRCKGRAASPPTAPKENSISPAERASWSDTIPSLRISPT